jgi:hypothetical protein
MNDMRRGFSRHPLDDKAPCGTTTSCHLLDDNPAPRSPRGWVGISCHPLDDKIFDGAAIGKSSLL